MERVYAYIVVEPTTENCNEYFLKLASMEKEANKTLEKDTFEKWIVDFHDYIRKRLEDFPNKLFGFAVSKDSTKAYIVVFDKETDGNHYEIFFDEEKKKPYILVE